MAKKKFRHELKYLLNEGDLELLRQRLKTVLSLDSHATGGEYFIRSLYFDDYYNSAYEEKMAGVADRKKYRIRIYDCSDKIINLECKQKSGNYIFKRSAKITREEYDKIIHFDYGFLLKSDNPLCREFYYECTSKVLRPRVIVDYDREPYILKEGTVRVTIDKNVRSSYPGCDIFDPDIPTRYCLDSGKQILEVKYTEFLPKVVKDILPVHATEFRAVSKFILCCEAADYTMPTK